MNILINLFASQPTPNPSLTIGLHRTKKKLNSAVSLQLCETGKIDQIYYKQVSTSLFCFYGIIKKLKFDVDCWPRNFTT